MTSDKSKQTVRLLCPEVRSEFIEDFFARMDADYFETFSPGQISIKHAPDDGGQEDYRGGKQQSGDYLSPQSSGASSSSRITRSGLAMNG